MQTPTYLLDKGIIHIPVPVQVKHERALLYAMSRIQTGRKTHLTPNFHIKRCESAVTYIRKSCKTTTTPARPCNLKHEKVPEI